MIDSSEPYSGIYQTLPSTPPRPYDANLTVRCSDAVAATGVGGRVAEEPVRHYQDGIATGPTAA